MPVEVPHSAPAARPAGGRSIGRTLLVLALSLLGLGTAAWLSREQLLQGVEELWVISDPVGPADAVVVLGGGLDTRPFAAAKYYREGLTKKILVSNVPRSPTETLGFLSHAEANRRVLLKLDVPDSAIELFGEELSNTHEEALALRDWVVRTHAQSIIVPTEPFPARRTRWILTHELAGSSARVQVPVVDDPAYPSLHWWKDEKAIVAFQNEILKYIYYRLKY